MDSIKCIVIDGWHKGHMVILPQMLSVLRLHRPAVTTICDCSEFEETFKPAPSIDTYRLAFAAVDGKSAIYTVKGDSEPMVSNRDWHTYANDKPWKDTPLYVNCHDDRAIFAVSSEVEE